MGLSFARPRTHHHAASSFGVSGACRVEEEVLEEVESRSTAFNIQQLERRII
jgi:hypothetical protein